MSRDQKPGKVRHVGVVQDRRATDAPGGAGASAGGAAASATTAATPAAGGGGSPDAAAPTGKGGIGKIAILMFLIFAGVGGGGIVALAPRLGLWP